MKHIYTVIIKNRILTFPTLIFILLMCACSEKKKEGEQNSAVIEKDSTQKSFKSDVDFLKRYTDIIILQDSAGKSKLVLCAALQGRVMTSTAAGDDGTSYGWINRQAFLSGDTSEHINVFGGEDRFWLGPEGGQFSIYFSKGADFNLSNWHVPRLIDLEPFNLDSVTESEAVFTRDAALTNYSGTTFNFGIKRKVKLIPEKISLQQLGLDSVNNMSIVAYETINTLKNKGKAEWKKKTGLLSIWILGMFNPSKNTIIIIPYRGKSNALGSIVNDSYFGHIPTDRLTLDDKAVYLKGDGKHRGKIGLPPNRATGWMGSYDPDKNVLTLVSYSVHTNSSAYVNSLWEIQKQPYNGDIVNAYNDGPPTPDAKPLGPFYELESSSPAAELKPDNVITHVHTTYHIKGSTAQLDSIMFKVLGVVSPGKIFIKEKN